MPYGTRGVKIGSQSRLSSTGVGRGSAKNTSCPFTGVLVVESDCKRGREMVSWSRTGPVDPQSLSVSSGGNTNLPVTETVFFFSSFSLYFDLLTRGKTGTNQYNVPSSEVKYKISFYFEIDEGYNFGDTV